MAPLPQVSGGIKWCCYWPICPSVCLSHASRTKAVHFRNMVITEHY